MNPEQLRKLADKMEKIFPKLKAGDSTFVDSLGHANNLHVELQLDQEWFEKNK